MPTCDVYLNRSRMKKDGKRVYSIRKQRKVRWHNSFVLLADVNFVVNEKGRQTTLKRLTENKPKIVHAFLRGNLLRRGRAAREALKQYMNQATRVFYNPTLNTSFVTEDGKPIQSAEYAILTTDAIYAF